MPWVSLGSHFMLVYWGEVQDKVGSAFAKDMVHVPSRSLASGSIGSSVSVTAEFVFGSFSIFSIPRFSFGLTGFERPEIWTL